MSDLTTPTASRDLEIATCAARATMYALLAYGLSRPTPTRWRAVKESLLPAATSIELPGPLEEGVGRLLETGPDHHEELALSHLELFPPVAHPDAPGYETAYRGDDLFRQMDLLADVAGFYRAHGLKVGGEERERPDHIVAELEFCSLVCRKQLHALLHLGEAEVEICHDTMVSFLTDHLACWAPAFGRRAAAVATHPWYRAAGELTALWVEADADAFGVVPSEVAERPLPQAPPDDGSCGPCPVGTAT